MDGVTEREHMLIAATVARTLRYVAGSFIPALDDGEHRDRGLEYQASLIEIAGRLELAPIEDWTCCPVCEEITCDSSCPLASVRKNRTA